MTAASRLLEPLVSLWRFNYTLSFQGTIVPFDSETHMAPTLATDHPGCRIVAASSLGSILTQSECMRHGPNDDIYGHS